MTNCCGQMCKNKPCAVEPQEHQVVHKPEALPRRFSLLRRKLTKGSDLSPVVVCDGISRNHEETIPAGRRMDWVCLLLRLNAFPADGNQP